MGKVVAVINQKGGVGKTTTAACLIAGLAAHGMRVLGVDLDAQCNLTFALNAQADFLTSLEVLKGESEALEAIQKTQFCDFIAASTGLSGADAFIKETGREYKLKEALQKIKENYNYIILDTPPALGILTVNALTASDEIIIPAQADIFSIQGIVQLTETIYAVRKYCNNNLKILGILLTRYNNRTVLSRDIYDTLKEIASKLDTKVFKTTIREGISIKESQINRQDLFKYAPKEKVTNDYKNFINEFLGK